MAPGDPWSLIRWNRRFFFALPLVFALRMVLGLFLFPPEPRPAPRGSDGARQFQHNVST